MAWSITAGEKNLPKIIITHRAGSSAEIYLNGAQLTSWNCPPAGERIFLSSAANFEDGKAIRGGVPVVFPQFADSGPLPKHGWLRNTVWDVDESTDPLGQTVRLRTSDTQETRSLWDFPYEATLDVSLYETSIEMRLGISNTGNADMPFTAALHTYLAVSDLSHASVIGLYGSRYIDKTRGRLLVKDEEQALRISGETDRIYPGAPWRLVLTDADTRVDISENGFRDVVVWNPWTEVTRGIADLHPHEYLKFICIEAAIAAEPIVLPPGESWSGTQELCIPG
ncbi:MAG TPA: D-hexose-6-phosphate mutarotase [Gemmatimonadaceae bacterium]